MRRVTQHRPIRIGNAAAAIEPIGGEGMGLALRSAERLAFHFKIIAHSDSSTSRDREGAVASSPHQPLPHGRGSLDPWAMLEREYHRLWRRRRIACRSVAVLAGTAAFGPLLHLAARFPPIVEIVMSLMGKEEGFLPSQAGPAFGR